MPNWASTGKKHNFYEKNIVNNVLFGHFDKYFFSN